MSLSIGFVTYNESSFKYLPYFLPSLKWSIQRAQISFPELSFFVHLFDNSDQSFSDNKIYTDKFYQQNTEFFSYKYWYKGSNLGFSKAYNILMNEALSGGSELFLMINPDVLLEEDFIERLLRAYYLSPKTSVFAPRILYWNFSCKEKTEIIDSYGVGATLSHHFFDQGQGISIKNYSFPSEAFGFTGAAALLNLSLLKDVAIDNGKYLEFFDELIFMYKEDVDLSYRVRALGQEILFVPQALIYHDRTLKQESLFKKITSLKNDLSRQRSLLHQLLILHKATKLPFSFFIKLRVFLKIFFLKIYALLFSPQQLFLHQKNKKYVKINKRGLKFSSEGVKNIERLMKK